MYDNEALWFIEGRDRIYVVEEFYPGWEEAEKAVEDLERLSDKPVVRVSCGLGVSLILGALAVL